MYKVFFKMKTNSICTNLQTFYKIFKIKQFNLHKKKNKRKQNSHKKKTIIIL